MSTESWVFLIILALPFAIAILSYLLSSLVILIHYYWGNKNYGFFEKICMSFFGDSYGIDDTFVQTLVDERFNGVWLIPCFFILLFDICKLIALPIMIITLHFLGIECITKIKNKP